MVPPPEPSHIFAQHILALSLQEGRIGRLTWREWLSSMPAFAAMAEDYRPPTEEEIDALAKRAMVAFDIPGIAVGIVKAGLNFDFAV